MNCHVFDIYRSSLAFISEKMMWFLTIVRGSLNESLKVPANGRLDNAEW